MCSRSRQSSVCQSTSFRRNEFQYTSSTSATTIWCFRCACFERSATPAHPASRVAALAWSALDAGSLALASRVAPGPSRVRHAIGTILTTRQAITPAAALVHVCEATNTFMHTCRRPGGRRKAVCF
eukprot:2440523-Pleurochrysis_carterae.AAC.3